MFMINAGSGRPDQEFQQPSNITPGWRGKSSGSLPTAKA